MTGQLTNKDAVRVAAEFDKLERENKAPVGREQWADLLRRLGLSEELVDEARGRVKQKKSFKKRILSAFVALVSIGVMAALGTSLFIGNTQQEFELLKVTASDTMITTSASETPTSVESIVPGHGYTYVHVTLHNVPVGQRLPVRADWIQPDGERYHAIAWHTKLTVSPTIETHAHCEIDPGAPTGEWQARLYLLDRHIATQKFQVR